MRQLNPVSNENVPSAGAMRVEVYPNPATNQVQIQVVRHSQRPATIEVVDALGRQMHFQPLTKSRSEISLTGLAAGVYLVKLSDRGQTRVASFIVAE